MKLLHPRPLAERTRPRDLLDVPLDEAQRAAVARPPGGAMLVLGEAGYGKTTVALARLAHLYRNAREPFRAVVIVPHEGLVRLLQPALVRRGVDVAVRTYAHWARALARRTFGDLPRREGRSTSVAVARMKRHPSLLAILQEHALSPPGVIDDDADAPPPKTTALANRGDLQHIFGDFVRMKALARDAAMGAHAVEAILEHTHVQFSLRAERAYAHVDRERLVTSDGLSLDEGTPTEDAGSIDVEDYAVLFELDRLRAAHLGLPPSRTRRYDCIVLDEAQELAPIELALVRRCLAKDATLVVAGDGDQQIDPTTAFRGWESTMAHLGAEDAVRVELDVGYRCAPETMRLARAVRDRSQIDQDLPTILRFADEASFARWLVDELDPLVDEDPTSSTCIVTRRPATARRVAAALKGRIPRRLALDGAPAQHSGVVVTTVDAVQGLEWDFVVVADANADDWPDDAASRRAMYVALTRARRRAVLASTRAPTPIVSAAR